MHFSKSTEKISQSFSSHFSSLEDPRRTTHGHHIYPLEEILFLVVSSVVSGWTHWTEIEEFGTNKLNWLRKFYNYPDGVPSHDALGKLFARLDHEAFNSCFISWVNARAELSGGDIISIDGKTARGSSEDGSKAAVHTVSAYAFENRLTLAQKTVFEKSNEITAIPELLDLLTIEGSVVTIDAMGCQKKIAEKIIEKKANYTLMVKGNQQALHEQIKSVFGHTVLADQSIEYDLGHGRIEERKCSVITDLRFLDEAVNWKGIQSLVRVESKRTNKPTEYTSQETRYYISSAKKTAKEFNHIVRSHWAIENNLHWCLDVLFKEDASKKRKGNSAKNFNMITKMALAMIEKMDNEKIPKTRKRQKCALNDEYRELVLSF
ncbi:MAG: ISAs1 family transposase [Cyclobacteriaceae bacterium]